MKYALIILTLFLTGCATAKAHQQACAETQSLLAVGMTHDQVRNLYGHPRYIRSGYLKGGERTEMWAYLNKGCPRDNTLVFFDNRGQVDHWQIYVPRDRNEIFFLSQNVEDTKN